MATPKPLTEAERALLSGWLNAHHRALAGWPTSTALEPLEQRTRLERLIKHGCPVQRIEAVAEADTMIAWIRTQKRADYVKRVASGAI